MPPQREEWQRNRIGHGYHIHQSPANLSCLWDENSERTAFKSLRRCIWGSLIVLTLLLCFIYLGLPPLCGCPARSHFPAQTDALLKLPQRYGPAAVYIYIPTYSRCVFKKKMPLLWDVQGKVSALNNTYCANFVVAFLAPGPVIWGRSTQRYML